MRFYSRKVKMEIKRFFVNEKISSDEVFVTGDEFYHASKVLRLKKGFKITLCDGSGYDFNAEIECFRKDGFVARITDKQKNERENQYYLCLFQACPKKNTAEYIVQKAVELGYNEINFFKSEYTEEKDYLKARLEKIAKDAAKQSRRACLVKINEILNFEGAVEKLKSYDAVIFANEREKTKRISEIKLKGSKSIAVIVGSEGGFSLSEEERFIKAGADTVTLGKRILRVDTAFITISALVDYRYNEENKFA